MIFNANIKINILITCHHKFVGIFFTISFFLASSARGNSAGSPDSSPATFRNLIMSPTWGTARGTDISHQDVLNQPRNQLSPRPSNLSTNASAFRPNTSIFRRYSQEQYTRNEVQIETARISSRRFSCMLARR